MGSKGAPPNTGEENYDLIKRVWNENNFNSLKDLLIYYNEADVGPLVKACEVLMGCFTTLHLDCFKSAISVSGLSRILVFR